jgi:succinate-semialdehyde dehydrogenase / glutarate-semialdehyde dehydrogenase
VGDGFDADTYMGPVANARRIGAMESLTAEALGKGGRLILGGKRLGTRGHFYSPTIIADVSTSARAMNEEPFGPLALVAPFATLQDALTEANRLPYGLASFAYTGSLKSEALISERIEAGMLAINRVFQSLPEAPFGGVKDSGYGTEGGTQAIRNFLNEKVVARSF